MKTDKAHEDNIRRVYAMAQAILEKRKMEAVKECDFERSLGIANNEATVENYLRQRYGINVSVKHRGNNWVMFDS